MGVSRGDKTWFGQTDRQPGTTWPLLRPQLTRSALYQCSCCAWLRAIPVVIHSDAAPSTTNSSRFLENGSICPSCRHRHAERHAGGRRHKRPSVLLVVFLASREQPVLSFSRRGIS